MSLNVTKRKAQKNATRRTLLDSAHKLFVARGYAGTNIGDISKAAGVAHGTFYVHFASKEEVADALLAEVNDTLAKRISAMFLLRGKIASLREAVSRAAKIFMDTLGEHREFVLWYRDRIASGINPGALRDGINPPAVAILTGAIQAFSNQQGVSLRGESAIVQGILALWLRVSMQWLLDQRTSRLDAEFVLVEMTIGALESVMKSTSTSARKNNSKKPIQRNQRRRT